MSRFVSYILWYNSSTGETQFWYMDKHKLVGRRTVLEENGCAALASPLFSIAGTGDFDGDGSADILWRNSSTGELQIWFMDGHTLADRKMVLAEDGKAVHAGSSLAIAGTGDFDGDENCDILLCNSATGELQVWHMDGHRLVGRRTLLAEDGNAILVRPPYNIVGAADFSGNGRADIVCYDSSIGETQIWCMDGHRLVRRDTVVRENGNAVFICSPNSIAAVADFDGNGSADIVWYDSFTGQADVWYMDRNFVLGRGTVLGLDSTIAFMAPPLSIAGAGTSLIDEMVLAEPAANGRSTPGSRLSGSRTKWIAQASFESNM